jgi:endonuclease G
MMGHAKGSLKNNFTFYTPMHPAWLHYTTDTQPGSSGPPVYKDQWYVAALHHAGIPEHDAHGNIIGWVANEGVRISKIMAHLNQAVTRLSKKGRRRTWPK